MSFGVSAADIAKLGKIAWQLWELGFSKAKNAGLYASAIFMAVPCLLSAEQHLL